MTSPLIGMRATVKSWITYELAKAYMTLTGRVVSVFDRRSQTWVGVLGSSGEVFDLPASCFSFESWEN